MRIAIVSAPRTRRAPPDYVASLAKGMEKMGHRVEVLDVWTDENTAHKLPGYEYIAIVAEQTALFGGKLPEVLHTMLKGGSGLGGKKSAAFLKKTNPLTGKALSNLMKLMEREGMLVNWSEILLSAPHAEEIGKRVGS
jgi:hypothetical protein